MVNIKKNANIVKNALFTENKKKNKQWKKVNVDKTIRISFINK